MRRATGQLVVALGVLALGAFVLFGAQGLPASGGYSHVGPGALPRLVGSVLVLLGALLFLEAWRSGFVGVDEAAERALRFDWRAFALISAGLLGYGLLVERGGFVLASLLLFVLVARAFGSRRWPRDALIGLVLAAGMFALFNLGLGLTLPAGLLAPLLQHG